MGTLDPLTLRRVYRKDNLFFLCGISKGSINYSPGLTLACHLLYKQFYHDKDTWGFSQYRESCKVTTGPFDLESLKYLPSALYSLSTVGKGYKQKFGTTNSFSAMRKNNIKIKLLLLKSK